MTGTVVEFPQRAESEAFHSEAPALPLERHVVASALMAERLRALSEQMMLLLQHMPRDAGTFARLHGEMLDAWFAIEEHHVAYRAVLECKGQA